MRLRSAFSDKVRHFVISVDITHIGPIVVAVRQMPVRNNMVELPQQSFLRPLSDTMFVVCSIVCRPIVVAVRQMPVRKNMVELSQK